MTLDEIQALIEAASGPKTQRQAHDARFRLYTSWPQLVQALLGVARAASRVHEFDDSPRADAQLQYEDAKFDMFSALIELEKLELK